MTWSIARTAMTVKPPATVVGTVDRAGDVDYFRFTAAAGDQTGVVTELTALDNAAAPLNHAFDAVGLRDCGSNQS